MNFMPAFTAFSTRTPLFNLYSKKHNAQPEKKIQHMCTHTKKHCLQILSFTVIDDFYLQTLATHGLMKCFSSLSWTDLWV